MATRRKSKSATIARKANKASRPGAGAQRAAHGSSTTGVLELRQSFGVNRLVFSRLSQFSQRAIAKWEAGERLSAPSQQRMMELKRLQLALSRVMQDDYLAHWLQTPNAAFAGLKPLEVVERGEVDRIWRMIYLMESGVPS